MALTDQEKILVLRAKSRGPELFTKETGLSAVARVAQRRGVRFILKGDTVEPLGSQGIIDQARADVMDFQVPASLSLPRPTPRQHPRHAAIRAKVKEWAEAAGPGTGLTDAEKDGINLTTFFGPELGVGHNL